MEIDNSRIGGGGGGGGSGFKKKPVEMYCLVVARRHVPSGVHTDRVWVMASFKNFSLNLTKYVSKTAGSNLSCCSGRVLKMTWHISHDHLHSKSDKLQELISSSTNLLRYQYSHLHFPAHSQLKYM